MSKHISFNHQNSKLNHLYDEVLQHSVDLEQELAKRGANLRLFRNANLLLSVISKITNKSTIWENFDYLEEENGEKTIVYKSWEIPIISTSEPGFESLITILIPYIAYHILYESLPSVDFDYYDDQYNLKQTSFYEIKNDTLYLKISVFMKKSFGGNSLIVPRAKILIDFKNPNQVSR